VRYIHSRLTMTLSAMADQWRFASMLVQLPISTGNGWSYVLWYQSETCTGKNFQAMTFWPDPMSFSLFVDLAYYSPLYFIAGLDQLRIYWFLIVCKIQFPKTHSFLKSKISNNTVVNLTTSDIFTNHRITQRQDATASYMMTSLWQWANIFMPSPAH